LAASGSPVTTSGTIALNFAPGYGIPTTVRQSEWDAAYNDKINTATFNTTNGVLTLTQQDGGTVTVNLDGRYLTTGGDSQTLAWNGATGELSISGGNTVDLDGRYLTSFTESDPVFSASPAAAITAPQISNWDTAFGWGNHAVAGYLLSSTAATTYQPLDGDLTSIAGLAGTTGLLRKTAANTWSLDTAAYLTANQSITVSGDATGTGTTEIALTLANTGVSAGTYQSVTVDGKGRITSGTNPTTLAGYGITDAAPLSHVGATGTAHGVATGLVDGFMAAADKTKLDGIASGATANTGTVTSVGLSTPTGLVVTGSPVTTSGTLALAYDTGYSIPTTAKQTLWDTALQPAAIGSTILAYDANLQSFINTFTLPTTDGTNGQVLTTNGAGAISFTTVSGGSGFDFVQSAIPTATAVNQLWCRPGEGFYFWSGLYWLSVNEFVLSTGSSNGQAASAITWGLPSTLGTWNRTFGGAFWTHAVFTYNGVSGTTVYDANNYRRVQIIGYSGAVTILDASMIPGTGIFTSTGGVNIERFIFNINLYQPNTVGALITPVNSSVGSPSGGTIHSSHSIHYRLVAA
jgi:hypothetical protein